MGVCFSRRGELASSPTKAPLNEPPREKKMVKEVKKEPEAEVVKRKDPEAEVKMPVFLVAAATACAQPVKKLPPVSDEEKKKAETLLKINQQEDGKVEEQRTVPLRTSSCTKEEIDAILIQCGRLSRSSSGKAETPGAGNQKKYSGSMRSYDFDNDEKDEGELDKPATKPSPRRRTPGREREHQKRSGSTERGSNGGGRRVSRSPGKRSDGPVSSTTSCASDKPRQQPAKMVSVPATEKAVVGEIIDSVVLGPKRVSSTRGLRNASPRSRSPAISTRIPNENAQPASLSRNNSRKAEQSPCRRNPMAEIDENSLKTENLPQFRGQTGQTGTMTQRSCGEVADAADSKTARRNSRDFDSNPGFNPTSYASLLLEEKQNTAFFLPACVSKACSILEAVADLNSSCSEHRSYEARRGSCRRDPLPFMESELVVNDLIEPSLHKYVTVLERGDTETRESAGSNSFVGQPWEPNSVDSSDRCCTRTFGNVKEVEVKEGFTADSDSVGHGQRSMALSNSKILTALSASGATPLGKKREFELRHIQRGDHGKIAGKAFSLLISAATS